MSYFDNDIGVECCPDDVDLDCLPDNIDCCTCPWLNSSTESQPITLTSNDWFFWYLMFRPCNSITPAPSGVPSNASIVHERFAANTSDQRSTPKPRYVLRPECRIAIYLLTLGILIIIILSIARVL